MKERTAEAERIETDYLARLNKVLTTKNDPSEASDILQGVKEHIEEAVNELSDNEISLAQMEKILKQLGPPETYVEEIMENKQNEAIIGGSWRKITTYRGFKIYFLSIFTLWITLLIYMIYSVVPKFNNIFGSFQEPLPFLTQGVLALSTLKLPLIIFFGLVLISLVGAVLQSQKIKRIVETNFLRNFNLFNMIFCLLVVLSVAIWILALFWPLIFT